jgi:hypothetical protein
MGVMQINRNKDEIRNITVIDEVNSIWNQKDERIPVILRKHAQMYFLPLGIKNFNNYLEILSESKLRKLPIRITFIEHTGDILSVNKAGLEDE